MNVLLIVFKIVRGDFQSIIIIFIRAWAWVRAKAREMNYARRLMYEKRQLMKQFRYILPFVFN
jgi:hypothetical protein